jgi:AbrB family looped-hinge helix DNA binding protein
MPADFLRAEVRLNAQGRLVIPAEFRKALGFAPGDELVMHIDDGGLRIETVANIIRRAQDEFARVPAERNLVKELLEQRRRDQQMADERLARLASEGRVEAHPNVRSA